jgi:predicted DNA binding CopG/RHH family protein
MKTDRKNRIVKVRVTEPEEERMKELAEAEGLTLSEYMRRRSLRKRKTEGAKADR